MRATILHADLDAFYASVEQLLDPSLRGIPMAVGGGVVLAASYEAKAFGVAGGMSGVEARRLCPQLVFVPGRFRDYSSYADRVMAIFEDFTPEIERISIDEAFLDVSGSEHLFGPAPDIAAIIRRRVRDEVGLPISVGVARTKHLAKIASQVAKPDGLVVVPPDDERAFLDPLPVSLMWGVGPVTERRLAGIGVATIGDLAALDGDRLAPILGDATGHRLADLAWNRDPRRVVRMRKNSSMSAQSAFGRKAIDRDHISMTLRHLSDRVAARLRRAGVGGSTVGVRVRFPSMQAITRAVTLPAPVSATAVIAEIADHLVSRALADHPDEAEISLLAVSVSHLANQPALQMELPLDTDEAEGDAMTRPGSRVATDHWRVDRAIDAVREKFGRQAVDYASVRLAREGSVPDEFRELAERERSVDG